MKIIIWLILCLIWGSTWIFIKIGLRDLPPITFASTRFILALLILGAIIFARKIPFPRSKREWQLLGVTGFLQFSINYSLVFWSEQYISSGLAAVLQSMIPIFGLALAWFHLPSERITAVKVFSLLMGVAGVGIIFIEQLQINSVMAFWGSVGIVFGAYAAAHASVLTKAYGTGMHPASLVFGQMLCGVLPIVIYSFTVEGNPLRYNWSLRAVISVLYLTVFGTIAAFWLYYRLLSKIESTKAMTIALVTPLIAVLMGGIFLGERLPMQTFLGAVFILASIGLIVFRRTLKAGWKTETP